MNLAYIQGITEEVRLRLRRKTAYNMPDNPTQRGVRPDEIKRYMAGALIDQSDSVVAEINRIVTVINGLLGDIDGEVSGHGDVLMNLAQELATLQSGVDGLNEWMGAINEAVGDLRYTVDGNEEEMEASLIAIYETFGELRRALEAVEALASQEKGALSDDGKRRLAYIVSKSVFVATEAEAAVYGSAVSGLVAELTGGTVTEPEVPDVPGGDDPVTPGGDDDDDDPVVPGGDEPGGDDPVTPGGDDTGGDEPVVPGGDEPGGDDPVTPGGDEPGGDDDDEPVTSASGEVIFVNKNNKTLSVTLDQEIIAPNKITVTGEYVGTPGTNSIKYLVLIKEDGVWQISEIIYADNNNRTPSTTEDKQPAVTISGNVISISNIYINITNVGDSNSKFGDINCETTYTVTVEVA